VIETLYGPGGIALVLDSGQIFPDDPGQGTPAIVEYDHDERTYTSTFWAALGEGELLDKRGEPYDLSARQHNWLLAQESAVSEFLNRHGG